MNTNSAPVPLYPKTHKNDKEACMIRFIFGLLMGLIGGLLLFSSLLEGLEAPAEEEHEN